MRKIILASASPRRRELLKQAGILFEVMESAAEERTEKTAPFEVVTELAEKKAESVLKLLKGDVLVIGADTIVSLDGEILGKPKDEEDAKRMLGALSGRTHQVYTGVSLLFRAGGSTERKSFYEETAVTMYPIEETETEAYIRSGEPFDKAGAYGIQGRAAVFVKEIKGDYNNVVGLPLARVYQEIKKWIKDEGEDCEE